MSNAESTTTIDQNTIPFAPTQVAFEKHKSAIVAVPLDGLREARVDLNGVFTRTVIVIAGLREMRPLVVARLPDTDIAIYDSIEERMYAAHYCNTLWQAKAKDKEDVGARADALEDRYDGGLLACRILIKYRLLEEGALERLKPLTGHEALMHNASVVLGVLRGLAPEVLSQTPLKALDVKQLEHDLLAFQTAWGRREYAERTRDEAAILRAQAFTYLYEAYEVARRAALYIYGLERGVELVPSLFTNNGNRKNGGTADEATATDASGQPAAANGQTASAKSSAKSDVVTPATFVMENTANLPLTNPFDLSSDRK